MSALAPLPYDAPLTALDNAGKPTPYIASEWYLALTSLQARSQASTNVLGTPTTLSTAQTAAIGTTPLTIGAVSAGLYRVSWYARIATPAGVSSALTVTISWTQSGVSLTKSGTLLNGNTTGTYESNAVPLIQADSVAPISYSTTYASNPPNAMGYQLFIACELIH